MKMACPGAYAPGPGPLGGQMTGMFGALLIAGLVAAPLCTVGLLTRARRPDRTSGAWPSARRFAAGGGRAPWCWPRSSRAGCRLLRCARVQPRSPASRAWSSASLVWLPVTRRWNARAHLCWAATIFLFVVYLAFVLDWTFNSHLGRGEHGRRAAAVGVRGLRRAAGCAYLWEICDALGTEHWRRRVTAARPRPGDRRRAAVGQPARAGAQRAAGHGHRHAARADCGWTTRATRSS